MEEKRRDAGTPPSAGMESPSSEPAASSRRRAGSHKRKLSSLGLSSSSSAPSKRAAREKALLSNLPIHNGPLTRARQGPNNISVVPSASSVHTAITSAHPEASVGDASAVVAEELKKVDKLEALEASFEAEYEAIRSRAANAHIVPSHCGWFSWTDIHPIEEQRMPSFFNGKSETRNPDMYMEIRNWIVQKFHADPNSQIEVKDISELEVGDMDARQEVMEFLDHWGLINFHPFPPTGSISEPAPAPALNDDGAGKTDSLVEKLYHFETLQSNPTTIAKSHVATLAMPSGLFPESTILEELVRPGGPSVEYHCNSCSADCSRKRYHCQKQADFDLCTDCFNNGKFDSDMSSSDFILMEPAEAPGVSGGKWTDQETLLLLEALELYKENWNEIAEHVATKTKAQCILHFVQMPIEDTFLDCDDDDVDASSKDPPSTANESSVPQDATETTETKNDAKESQSMISPVEASNKEDNVEVKAGKQNSKPEEVSAVKNDEEKSAPEDSGQEISEGIALKTLIEAFEAIGYSPTPDNPLSFAEVGNPVMALAAFLSRLIGPDVASASAHSSLKAINSNSPAIELATRHCFLLEDPPNEKEEITNSESVVAGSVDGDGQKDEKQEHANKEEYDDDEKKDIDSASDEKMDAISEKGDSIEKSTSEKVEDAITHQEVGPNNKDPSNSELSKDNRPVIQEESSDLKSKVEITLTSTLNIGEKTCDGDPSQPAETPKDVDMSDAQLSEKNEPEDAVTSKCAEVSLSTEVSNDMLGKDEPKILDVASSVGEVSQITKEPREIDMVSDPQAEKTEQLHPDTSKPTVDNTASTDPSAPLPSGRNESSQPVVSDSVVGSVAGGDQNQEGKEEDLNCSEKKVKKIDRLKRAAVTALTAATVKAKVLADQEEHQIRILSMVLIENLLHKLEAKLAFFNEMDNAILRLREQLDRTKQRLYQERAQIIAARLGIPASSSRGGKPQSLPTNRIVMNLAANSVPRPPMSMAPSQRPPTIVRPVMGPVGPATNNSFPSTTIAGSQFRPSVQDKLSSVGTK